MVASMGISNQHMVSYHHYVRERHTLFTPAIPEPERSCFEQSTVEQISFCEETVVEFVWGLKIYDG